MRSPFSRKTKKATTNGGTSRDTAINFDEAYGEPTDASEAASSAQRRGPGPLTRLIAGWWDRVISATFSGTFTRQEEQYAAGSTRRDYLWNSIGLAAWGGQFPLLTIITTQLAGVETAGKLSMAYVVSLMLWYLGNYGARTYQVSDLEEHASFYSYQVQRVITCLLMVAVGLGWGFVRGYADEMASIFTWVLVFRAVDALADVFEGRLQQVDKLYLAGISQTIRCATSLVAFAIVLLVTGSVTAASVALAVLAIASLVIVTVPLAYFETPASGAPGISEIGDLFVQCFPTASALLLYALVDAMPKFAMEGMLSYDNQLYYNALYFPAHAIIMTVGFIYKPMLVHLAGIWADATQRKKFDLVILGITLITVAITAGMAFLMSTVGIPVMSVLYGVDFEQFRGLTYVMVAAGGMAALIDFLYQVITVLRKQGMVTRIYAIGFAASIPICYLLVGFTGLEGAVLAGLFCMGILAVELISAYFGLRWGTEEHTNGPDAEPGPQQPGPQGADTGDDMLADAYSSRSDTSLS